MKQLLVKIHLLIIRDDSNELVGILFNVLGVILAVLGAFQKQVPTTIIGLSISIAGFTVTQLRQIATQKSAISMLSSPTSKWKWSYELLANAMSESKSICLASLSEEIGMNTRPDSWKEAKQLAALSPSKKFRYIIGSQDHFRYSYFEDLAKKESDSGNDSKPNPFVASNSEIKILDTDKLKGPASNLIILDSHTAIVILPGEADHCKNWLVFTDQEAIAKIQDSFEYLWKESVDYKYEKLSSDSKKKRTKETGKLSPRDYLINPKGD